MRKKLNAILALSLLSSVLILSGCKSTNLNESTSKSKLVSTDTKYADGTYTGVAKGMKKNLNIDVDILDGKIKDIKLGATKDDKPYITDAEKVIPLILEKQGTEGVDVISGATYSSKGIFKAVNDALLQAKGDVANSSKGQPPFKPRADEGSPKISWLTAYDSKYKMDDWHNGVALTNDGGYMCASYVEETDEVIHGALIKYDKSGNLEWEKLFNGCEFSGILKTDSGYMVTGHADKEGDFADIVKGGTDAIVLMVDESGKTLWQKSIGGSEDDEFTWEFPATELPNGNFAIPGGFYSNDGDFKDKNTGEQDAFLVEIDKSGAIVSLTCVGGTKEDFLTGVAPLKDGGLAICGYTNSIDGNLNEDGAKSRTDEDGEDIYDGFILKLDKDRKTTWTKRLVAEKSMWGGKLIESSDGGILQIGGAEGTTLNGEKLNFKGEHAMYILKMDKDGKQQWVKTYIAEKGDNGASWGSNIIKLPNGKYLAWGSGEQKLEDEEELGYGLMYVIDEQGEQSLEKKYFPEGYEGYTQIVPTSDNGLIAVGWQASEAGDYDGFIIKYEPLP